MDTPKDVDLADTCLNGQSNVGAPDELSDPFVIVIDQPKRQNRNTTGSTPMSNNLTISASERYNSLGDSSPPSQHNQMNRDAANPFANSGSKSNSVIDEFQAYIFRYNPTFTSIPHYFYRKSLQMPVRLNPHNNVLRRSLCLREQRENEKLQNSKSYVTFGIAVATKLFFGLFFMIALVTNIKNSKTKNKPERNLYRASCALVS